MSSIAFFRLGSYDRHLRVVPREWVKRGIINLPTIEGYEEYRKVAFMQFLVQKEYVTVHGFSLAERWPEAWKPRNGAESDFAEMAFWGMESKDELSLHRAVSNLYLRKESDE